MAWVRPLGASLSPEHLRTREPENPRTSEPENLRTREPQNPFPPIASRPNPNTRPLAVPDITATNCLPFTS